MEKIKLASHVKRGDTFYTPLTDPEGIGDKLSLSSWSKCWLPEFIWIGLIIHKQGRRKGLESLYHIIKELNEKGIAVPQLSKIYSLQKVEQEIYWEIIKNYVGVDVLSPLTIVITPDINETFYNVFFDFSLEIEDGISELINIAEGCNNFHDELSTDICFVVDWFYVLSERLQLFNRLDMLSDTLTEYYNHMHEDEIMRTYRPMIRATFQGLCNLDCSKEFSENFWKILGQISVCNPVKIVWEEDENEDFYSQVTNLMKYFATSNEDMKMNTKYCVSMGMVCYIHRLYKEIIEKQMQNDVGGRILFRTMLETYINLKYLLLQESEIPDIYERFKAYGCGKYKLVMAKLRERKYSVSNDSQIDEKYLELLVNENTNEAFIDMSIGFFDKTSIRDKFHKCNEDELYEIYYEYGTNYAHGFWGAIRESSMLICDNPIHTYHTVPDFGCEQNLRSVLTDSEMILRKTFDIIASFIEMPEFYN